MGRYSSAESVEQEFLLATIHCQRFLSNYNFQFDININYFEAMGDIVLNLYLRKSHDRFMLFVLDLRNSAQDMI